MLCLYCADMGSTNKQCLVRGKYKGHAAAQQIDDDCAGERVI